MVKDDVVFYEGVNNRDNVKRIIEGMEKAQLEAIDIVNDWRDVPLNERVRRANELGRGRKCVYISIHSDANSNGKEWNQASGILQFEELFQHDFPVSFFGKDRSYVA